MRGEKRGGAAAPLMRAAVMNHLARLAPRILGLWGRSGAVSLSITSVGADLPRDLSGPCLS